MRKADFSNKFKRDFRRELKGIHRHVLDKGGELERLIVYLEHEVPLPSKYKDHVLKGKWKGYRDCHIRPDFLLIYRYEGDEWLILERLGSHSELFDM